MGNSPTIFPLKKIGQTRLYLLQVDGRKIAIDYYDSKISQGSGGKILEQLLLRSKPIHQETKTAPTSEKMHRFLVPTHKNLSETDFEIALVLRISEETLARTASCGTDPCSFS